MLSAQDSTGRGFYSAGRILQLITSRQAQTRSDIADVTGLARSTVQQRLDVLFEAQLILETEERKPSRGRPSQVLKLNHSAGLIVAIDVGEERTRIAIGDLSSKIIAETVEQLTVNSGPDHILDKIAKAVTNLIRRADLTGQPLVGIGLGLPAPVDFEAGQVAGWSIMSGWDGFDIRQHLAKHFQAPIFIDNDVNLLTLAEHRRHWPDVKHLLYVKAGNGIGSGMIIDGHINRGAQGAAGDIGHAHIRGYGDPVCRCGNLGCLEALVGGWALARDLNPHQDTTGHGAREISRLVQQGDPKALAALRAGGRVLGGAVAYATSLLNPSVIVVGGLLATSAGDHLVAGVREVIYQRALPLATRQLHIGPTKWRSRAGIAGAAYLVLDHILDPNTLDQNLSSETSPFRRAQ